MVRKVQYEGKYKYILSEEHDLLKRYKSKKGSYKRKPLILGNLLGLLTWPGYNVLQICILQYSLVSF